MKRLPLLAMLLVILGIVALVSMLLGRYPVSLTDFGRFVAQYVSSRPVLDEARYQTLQNLVVDIRLPRIVAAILIGSALSVSGVIFQSLFINPLVSPGLLGVLAGASFGSAVGMLVGQSWFLVQVGAFVFGLAAVLVAIGIASIYRGDRLLILILGGIVSSALFTSLLSVVKYLADPYEQLPAITYWLMGGLSAIEGRTVWAVSVPVLGGIALAFLLSGYLNVLSMGDEEAQSLGVNVRLLRFFFVFLATVISALTVVMGGIINWVGLIIPHIARMIVGPNNRVLLPAAALIGAVYILIADDIARLLFRVEIPIGILTSLVGIPFFALVLRTARKGWG